MIEIDKFNLSNRNTQDIYLSINGYTILVLSRYHIDDNTIAYDLYRWMNSVCIIERDKHGRCIVDGVDLIDN